MNISLIITLIIMTVAFSSCLIFPIYSVRKTNRETAGYKKIRGFVVRFEEVFHHTKFQRIYYPVIKYTINGQNYEIISDVGYNLRIFMPKKLTILYNPENPNDAHVNNKNNLMIFVIFGFSIAILLMLYFLIHNLILG